MHEPQATKQYWMRRTHTPHLWSCLVRFVAMWGENTSKSNGSTQPSKVSTTCSRRLETSELSSSLRPMRMDVMNLKSNIICRAWFWVKLDLCSRTNFSCVKITPCDRLVTSSRSNFLKNKQPKNLNKTFWYKRDLAWSFSHLADNQPSKRTQLTDNLRFFKTVTDKICFVFKKFYLSLGY